jgi:hypothetical protein
LFLVGLARLAGEHLREVDARGEALLSERAHAAGGAEEGPARPRAGLRGRRRGPRHGRQGARVPVPRVLGQEQGRRAGGVRGGHQGGVAGAQATQKTPQVQSTLTPPFFTSFLKSAIHVVNEFFGREKSFKMRCCQQ